MLGSLSTGIEPEWELLLRQTVRKDLKFTHAQDSAVQKIWSDAEGGLKKGDFSRRAISRQGLILEIALPNFRRFGANLNPRQTDRLIQLSVQDYGPNALSYPGVVDYLHITASQLQKVGRGQLRVRERWDARIMDFARRNHIKMYGQKGGGRYPAETLKISQMRRRKNAELERTIRTVLTPEQNRRFSRLAGFGKSRRL